MHANGLWIPNCSTTTPTGWRWRNLQIQSVKCWSSNNCTNKCHFQILHISLNMHYYQLHLSMDIAKISIITQLHVSLYFVSIHSRILITQSSMPSVKDGVVPILLLLVISKYYVFRPNMHHFQLYLSKYCVHLLQQLFTTQLHLFEYLSVLSLIHWQKSC